MKVLEKMMLRRGDNHDTNWLLVNKWKLAHWVPHLKCHWGGKSLMVKAKQTGEDVCLEILANHNMPSWKWKLICQWIIPLLTGQLQTEWKAHQIKQETWPKQRIQEPTPQHSGHWPNTTTKRQWHKQRWFMYLTLLSYRTAVKTKPKTSTKQQQKANIAQSGPLSWWPRKSLSHLLT